MYLRYLFIPLCSLMAILLAVGIYLLSESSPPPQLQASLTVTDLLGTRGDTTGFAHVTEPRPLIFPADHGPHPAYRSEWWYYTGNVTTAAGRHFGFQLTFFRSVLTPKIIERPSAWSTNQIYMAHFALTDVSGKRFQAFERFSRAALGLAGAQAQPFRVWLEDWSVEGLGEETFPMRLRAAQDGIAIDLTLQNTKPIILQGDNGLSQKGAGGNASYYYSLTRMPTQGRVYIDGQDFSVQGLSWMDREWSTSALEKDQVGWDWFALQLSNHHEVMFYQIRQRDGSIDPSSSGILVYADGSTRLLTPDTVQIEILDFWQSPHSGTIYPSHWRLHIPVEEVELEIVPYLADQELNLLVRYWEGAVQIQGRYKGQQVNGSGYVELTGYGDMRLGQR